MGYALRAVLIMVTVVAGAAGLVLFAASFQWPALREDAACVGTIALSALVLFWISRGQ